MAIVDYDNPPEGVFVYRARTHFDDLDALWVMHHSRYLVHLERAQQALFDRMMESSEFSPERYPDLYVVVRRIEIDYLKPLRGVMPFIITLRGIRLREAGMSLAFAFRSPCGRELYTRGVREVCRMSLKTNEPTGWTENFRTRYEPWIEAGRLIGERASPSIRTD